MQYLIATYWMWFVVALLVGCAVGYWLRWRLGPHGGLSRVLIWGTAAFLIGLVVAVLHWLPRRAGLYLETLLLLSFWYAIGGLLGALLRGWTSGADTVSTARIGNVPPEAAALSERARAAVRSTQADTPASSGTIEDARLAVEARAADVARVAADARAAEEERIAAEAKAAEKARTAAAAKAGEDARLAVEAKAAELARIAAAAKAADDARRGAGAKATGEAHAAAVAKAAEDARLAAEARAAEEARAAAVAKAAEDARVAAEVKAAEEGRAAAAAKAADKAADKARLAAEAKAAEKARAAAAAKAADDARVAAEAKAAEEARANAAAIAAEEARLADEARIARTAREAAAEAANASGVATPVVVAAKAGSHPGSRPPGIAAPTGGEADDLKLIKGIGTKNEKACHALGIYRFGQIADWTPDEAIWVGHHIAFPGRIEREHWIAQARLLASGGETEHSSAVKSGSLVVDDSADEPLDQASAEMLAKNLPAQVAAVEGEDKHAGRRPYGLVSAIGAADNLKKIRGIGPQNERRLHALGIWHFSQIAAWSEDNVKWVGSYLAFAGRIDREKWIEQARDLAAGKDTEFSRRVAAGKVATSKGGGAKE